MFKLVQGKNPSLRQSVKGRRTNNLGDLSIVKFGAITLCKWCCSKPIRSPKAHYCSDECKTSAWMQMCPQTREGAVYLLARQRGKCADCGYSWKEAIRSIIKFLKEYDVPVTWFTIGHRLNGMKVEKSPWDDRGILSHRGVQVDHIIPIADGGTSFGFENCQALCVQCHTNKSIMESHIRRTRRKLIP